MTIARRDNGHKSEVSIADTVDACAKLLTDIQQTLLDEATARRDERTAEVCTLAEAREAAQTGWARVSYEAIREAEATGNLGDGLSIRCLQRPDGTLPESTEEGDLIAFIGRSY